MAVANPVALQAEEYVICSELQNVTADIRRCQVEGNKQVTLMSIVDECIVGKHGFRPKYNLYIDRLPGGPEYQGAELEYSYHERWFQVSVLEDSKNCYVSFSAVSYTHLTLPTIYSV